MKKSIDFFTAHPARFFLLAALLWGGVMGFLDYLEYKEGKFDPHDLLVEANGMVFDLLVFGILLSIYEALRERRDKIERLHEEIDDYRGWDEKEATYRIVGAVKRLKRLGVTKLDLNQCYLKEAKLYGVNFQGVFLKKANLQKAYLEKADLREADLHWANLEEANLEWATLTGAYLHMANLQKTSLKGADLQRADIKGANLQKANLQSANLSQADLRGAQLKEAELHNTKLWGADLAGAFLHGADLRGAKIEYAKLQGAVLYDAILDGASVDEDWFEKLEEWQVLGRQEIKEKYLIDENGVLREKQ